jgi:excisionase family DNA binding protein
MNDLDEATRAELQRRAEALQKEGVALAPWSMVLAAWQLDTARRPDARPLELLTVGDVRQLLRVSDDTVRRLIKAKELPVVWLGRSIRVLLADVDALVARGGARLDDDGTGEP